MGSNFLQEIYLLSFVIFSASWLSQTLFTLPHQTERGTAYDHITLNFERQDGSSLEIMVQKVYIII